MKPLIEKLTLSENTSFVARTYRTPLFEVPLHQHVEYELILFTEGEGMAFIGNHIGEFKTGDIFFLGTNLPHTFQKAHKDLVTSAVVVQFKEDFWGNEFMSLPETKPIRKLFNLSTQGIQLTGKSRQALDPLIKELEGLQGFSRIIRLCECLDIMACEKEFITVSTQPVKEYHPRYRERIDAIFQFTIDHFQEVITIAAVAKIAGMSVPAFCNYFRKSTKKTYIDFLNEIRIGYACKLLADTQNSVLDICYDSGFNTVANFNKQFMKLKKFTPSSYRKHFAKGESKDFVPQIVSRVLSE